MAMRHSYLRRRSMVSMAPLHPLSPSATCLVSHPRTRSRLGTLLIAHISTMLYSLTLSIGFSAVPCLGLSTDRRFLPPDQTSQVRIEFPAIK